jgi:ATP-dependent DNA helicase DinG
VAWAEPERGVVRVAPIEVADALGSSLLVHQPAVLTSATLTVGGSFTPFARRLGFLEDAIGEEDPLADDIADPIPRTYTGLRVEGSFDYSQQGLLYLAAGLPDPRSDEYPGAVVEEIAALAGAAGGRALLLTTSYHMLDRIAAGLVDTPYRVLVQGELPKKRLIAEFADDETAALVATMGYWEGIDVPGRSLSLVVIDRIPFPRPDDPLFEARREAVASRGGNPFQQVDLPRAAMLLAQGSGRLIRSEDDRGVVAILDNRITRMRYGARLVATLPRLRKVTDRELALRYLRRLADHSPTGR